ncbi:MAG TPA: fatty-acid oxidation protein subunit alpha [Bacteroidetes bacterium]|nr:fatty-acid oxidation protein subunit alpha [Bacteroidota bacterium]
MAKDKYHYIVKEALIKDGWTITHDPLRLSNLTRPVEIDLGAERLIGAQRGTEYIAVEIKSFLSLSELHDFYKAIGQFSYYREAMEEVEPIRVLFLAVPSPVYEGFFMEPISQKVLKNYDIKIIVYDIENKIIVKWKK